MYGKVIDEEKRGSIKYFDFFSFSFYNFTLLSFMNNLVIETYALKSGKFSLLR